LERLQLGNKIWTNVNYTLLKVKISRIQNKKIFNVGILFVSEESREQLAEVLAKGLKTEDTERTKSSCLERQLAAAEHMLQVRVKHSCLKRQLNICSRPNLEVQLS